MYSGACAAAYGATASANTLARSPICATTRVAKNIAPTRLTTLANLRWFLSGLKMGAHYNTRPSRRSPVEHPFDDGVRG